MTGVSRVTKFPRNIKVLEESVTAINFYFKRDAPGVHSVYSEGDPEFAPATTLLLPLPDPLHPPAASFT